MNPHSNNYITQTSNENNYSTQNIILFTPLQKITDKNLQELIEEFHNAPYHNHLEFRKTLLKLQQRYI